MKKFKIDKWREWRKRRQEKIIELINSLSNTYIISSNTYFKKSQIKIITPL